MSLAPEKPPEERRGRILVVDDDPAMRISLSGLLADDFEVEMASDVPEAEAALRTGGFDVVLSDYDMPGESGMDFLRRLNRTNPGVMGILLTGHGENPEVRRAEKDETVVRVISKPFDPGRLVKWMANTVRLARMRQAVNLLSARPVRTPMLLKVDYPGVPPGHGDVVLNVSIGGVFLRTSRRLQVGEVIRLDLSFPSALTPLAVDAEVRWQADGFGPLDSGYGMAFRNLSAEAKGTLQQLVDRWKAPPTRKLCVLTVGTRMLPVSTPNESAIPEIRWAATLKAGLEALQGQPAAAVVVELTASPEEVAAVIARLRSEVVYRTTPLVLIFGEGKVIPAIADRHTLAVCRPVEPANLFRTVQALCGVFDN